MANETAFSGISENMTSLGGIPKFSEISYQEFSFHLTLLPESPEFCFSEIQQFSDFLETFPRNFVTICLRFEIFGILGLNGERPYIRNPQAH